MGRVLLLQLDGRLPNLALMRISSHHFMLGDSVELRRIEKIEDIERRLGDDFDLVYASAIFGWSRPWCKRVREIYPGAIIGGSGWDESVTLEGIGINTTAKDYSIYPDYRHSIGYTQRGCRLKCWFCGVPRMEGGVKFVSTVGELWRGPPWPKELVLLDNDFFGEPTWSRQIEDLRTHHFKVSFCQGINLRVLTDEQAAAIASVNYRSINMDSRRIYTAWDNRDNERLLFRGLELLVKHGVNPDHIMVYMLTGADHRAKGACARLTKDDFYRHRLLREFGCRPYPMPYVKTPELSGFQRWVVKRIDLMGVSWEQFAAAGYRPERFGVKQQAEGQLRFSFGG